MRWLALVLIAFSTGVSAYDISYTCVYPTTRENGDALLRTEIAEVLIYVEDSSGQSYIINDTDDVCGGDITNLPGGLTTLYAATLDTGGLISDRSDSVTINHSDPQENRLLGAPGLGVEVVQVAEPAFHGASTTFKIDIIERPEGI